MRRAPNMAAVSMMKPRKRDATGKQIYSTSNEPSKVRCAFATRTARTPRRFLVCSFVLRVRVQAVHMAYGSTKVLTKVLRSISLARPNINVMERSTKVLPYFVHSFVPEVHNYMSI